MDKMIRILLKHRAWVVLAFLLATILSLPLSQKVKVNDQLADYLPPEAPSTRAMQVVASSFGSAMPDAQISWPAANLHEAYQAKAQLQALSCVEQVRWLDDFVDLGKPLSFEQSKFEARYYRNGRALFEVQTRGSEREALNEIYALGPEIQVRGTLVERAGAQNAVKTEVLQVTAVALPLILLILLLFTHAWLEPVVFMLTIGVAVALNMGSNVFLGEVSFITQAIAALLQLAVSMDYAIFLLARFEERRQLGEDAATAMIWAWRHSIGAVLSSGLTTLFGFLVLLFMRFRLGSDLGIVMAKGIVFSFISVLFFMPALILYAYPLIEKTQHRPLIPSFRRLGQAVYKLRLPVLILVLVLALPAVLASRQNHFIYGSGDIGTAARAGRDRAAMEADFGQMEQMALLVPAGHVAEEAALVEKLQGLPNVTQVLAYSTEVDAALPADLLDASERQQIQQGNWRLVAITAALPTEGEASFQLVEQVRQQAEAFYDQDYLLAGSSPSLLDLKETIQADQPIVTGLAILAMGLVILLIYRSLSLPLILVLSIEIAVWINLSIPYFVGSTLSYVGYLIISTVQLGATVDYAIIYSQYYLEQRKKMPVRQAIVQTTTAVGPSLLPPALILSLTGFALGRRSSIPMIAELGDLLCRGTLLSLVLVLFFLPALMALCDRIIPWTSWRLRWQEKGTCVSLKPDPKEPAQADKGGL